jgi:uncharacterized protein YrrD
MIEPGWTVLAADGTELGTVDEVVGDANADIFNGLAVATGLLGRSKYVPAERVAEIRDGQIALDLRAETIEQLDDHEPAPPSEQLRP